MAKVVITITDEPEGSASAVDIELVGSPAFDPHETAPEKLSDAQRLAMHMMKAMGKQWNLVEESVEFLSNNCSTAVH